MAAQQVRGPTWQDCVRALSLAIPTVHRPSCTLVKELWIFLKPSTKGTPTLIKGIWLAKTMSNDVHIIAVPGHLQLFVTRSVSLDMEMIGLVRGSLDMLHLVPSWCSQRGF